MDTATEERIVSIIDRKLSEVSHARPVRTEVVDALLDLRLRVIEASIFDWIETEELADGGRPKRAGFVGLMKRQP